MSNSFGRMGLFCCHGIICGRVPNLRLEPIFGLGERSERRYNPTGGYGGC